MGDTVGFVGLGAMGLPMTAVLAQSGVEMLVFDLSDEIRASASDIPGVTVAATQPMVSAEADVLFSCLPNNKITRAVYLEEGGIGQHGRSGLVTVDCSTVSPSVSQEIHAALAPKGISHIDASMLGSVPQAETGTLGFVVGGDDIAFAKVKPYLDTLGAMVRHAGPSGAGNRIKLIHQTLVAGHAVAVAEALAL